MRASVNITLAVAALPPLAIDKVPSTVSSCPVCILACWAVSTVTMLPTGSRRVKLRVAGNAAG